MAKRDHIPAKLRHEVFKRDNYRCRECGATNKETTLEIDYIVPVSKGGTNHISNLQTLCKKCNRAKYTRTWVGGKNNFISWNADEINDKPNIDSKRLRLLYLDKTKYNVCNNCDMAILKKYKSCPYCGSEDINLIRDYERLYQQKKTQKKLLGVCPKCNTSVTKYMENKTIMKCPK